MIVRAAAYNLSVDHPQAQQRDLLELILDTAQVQTEK
jgi:hypothetical protein